MMGEIYATAEEVVAWLGEPSIDSDLAIPFISSLKNAIEHFHDVGQTIVTLDALVKSLSCENLSANWIALGAFIHRPWFERVWIIQEVVLAAKPIIRCGDLTVKWESLTKVANVIQDSGLSETLLGIHADGHIRVDPTNLGNVINIDRIRSYRIARKMIGFKHILLSCYRFQATDPRDKIFGMLGMAINGEELLLEPDYTASIQDVYVRSACHLLTGDESLQLLHVAGTGYPRSIDDLPSWVPDWTVPTDISTYDVPEHFCLILERVVLIPE